jgi:DNA-binding transcriptional MerR regulator
MCERGHEVGNLGEVGTDKVRTMGWSTREVAELAGTSLRAVRHYHEVGLLEEPERLSNGYKQYRVGHLVRLLHIRRLTDLGFSLAQIAEIGEPGEHPAEALRQLDAQLKGTIERLQGVRAELGEILRGEATTDLPQELAPAAVAARLSESDRTLIAAMCSVMGPKGRRAYAAMLWDQAGRYSDVDFNALPAETGEAEREALAERLLPEVRELHERHPGLNDFSDSPYDYGFVQRTIGKVLLDIYNPAQLDVMRRIDLGMSDPD